ncbi:hypothetical protein KFK09_015646 [Dendrobium nobile]|uniref:Uncharacterized protein n=1 Tax=Dendrobium nobile TaxID=94219 RepID=A0A8T3B7V6_DENNO|nr:hypothetical protein KFK09_015646 [Dendrobium nobile]
MNHGVATCTMSFEIQPKWVRLGLGSSELKNRSLFPSHAGRLSYPRRWKHLCLRGEGTYHSPWDEKPYEILPGGRLSYLDEQDIVAFVDPPTELIPLDPESYNPAAYLWKKLEDIPEERRHRLLASLKPKHIPKIWELTGTRYQDAKLAKKIASALLSMDVNTMPPEYWRCRTSKGPMPFSWLNDFKKAIFQGKDGGAYGRIILMSKLYGPLYFTVREVTEIIPTAQPCDLVYEFGDGLLGLSEFPEGFPIPAKHPWPFNDHLVIYVRHAGPGVVVGQAWQEGNDLDQVPKKFCGEILMVKDYISSS